MINLNNSIREMLQNTKLDCHSNASTTSAGIIGFVSDMQKALLSIAQTYINNSEL
jgi:hypothetical protein